MSTECDVESIVEKLTTDGKDHLDPVSLSKLTNYAKSQRNNEELFDNLGRLTLHQLKQKHAQIRYSAFLLIDHFLVRSHLFRRFMLKRLEQIFELCFGLKHCQCTDVFDFKAQGISKQTVQPLVWAQKLKQKAIESYRAWKDKYGEKHVILKNGFRFLLDQQIIADVQSRPSQEPSSTSRSNRVVEFERKFEELENDTNYLIIQIDSCFELLIPKFQVTNDSTSEDSLHFRPMQGLSFNIILNTSVELVYDNSNCDLIDNLSEFVNELTKINRKLKDFEKQIQPYKYEELKEKIKDLSIKVISIIWKFNEIRIIKKDFKIARKENNCPVDENDDDDDDEFEEVPEREDVFLVNKIKGSYRVKLNPPQADEVETSEGDRLSCRALLPSGRLCPRRDQVNCPFHGRIIPRDKEGLPLDPDLKRAELDRRMEAKANEWRDPKYLKELSAQTGIDLEGKCRKRRKYPQLIDLKKLNSTPKKRLLRRFKKQLPNSAFIKN